MVYTPFLNNVCNVQKRERPHERESAPHLIFERQTLSSIVVKRLVETTLAAKLENHAYVWFATAGRREIRGGSPESDDVWVPNAYQDRELEQQLAHLGLDLRAIRGTLLDGHRRAIVCCTVDHTKRALVQLTKS